LRTLSVGVAPSQYDYLRYVKQRHSISMAAQVRELIRIRMDGGMISRGSGARVRIRHEVPPMDGKRTPANHVESVNEEMRGLLELGRKSAKGISQ